MSTHAKNPPFRSKRGFLAALSALVSAGMHRQTEAYKATAKRGFRNGKHGGKADGAFGGRNTAKPHRALYVGQK